MSLFIESICFINGELRNLDLHQIRFDQTRSVHFPGSEKICLASIIQIPFNLNNNKYKVRVVYGKEIESIEFIPYQVKEIKSIKLFEIDKSINYKYKSVNRSFLDNLLIQEECDDLILVKNQCITDTTFSNIIFFNGKEWHTPTTFLLEGIMRRKLINNGVIKEKNITVFDLNKYFSFKRINAMMDFKEAQVFDIDVLSKSL